ncbi:Hypothetical predicted protein [Mytilus galloprovincialis]|uniref:Fibrinogen C-terminal domain-containing protein n=1 Tax=Mytilus galloprovincialis TaxID=29158 RepID=A0A8B6GB85_MYTGA|nr:Hypothetical predicted protein [Mytilus galloprovincialis]
MKMILYTAICLIFFTGDNFAERTTGKDCASAVTFSGETATKVVELLSDNCACKKVKEDDEPQSSCTVKRPTDCGELDKSTCKSGIYKIFPDKTSGFKVFCEMKKHGGGWTVFQRRMNGKIQFYRDWDSYKQGFGNQNQEFWLGNDHLHQITSQGKYKMRIDMEDFENNRKYALYEKFSVGSESSGYILDVSGYSGDAVYLQEMAWQFRMGRNSQQRIEITINGTRHVQWNSREVGGIINVTTATRMAYT